MLPLHFCCTLHWRHRDVAEPQHLLPLPQANGTILFDYALITQWQHSYVADGKTFCIYLATDEDAIREHASIGG